MSLFEEYVSQDSESGNYTGHYDEYTEQWVDEASESIYGYSGHCDIHTDEANDGE